MSDTTSFEAFATRPGVEHPPLAESYDDEKVFRLNRSRCFARKPTDFMWFDLTKPGA